MVQPCFMNLRTIALFACGALFFAACGRSGDVSNEPQGAADVQDSNDIESCVSTLVDKGAPDALSRELCGPAAQPGAVEVGAPNEVGSSPEGDFERCVSTLVDKGASDALSRELCVPASEQQGAAEVLSAVPGTQKLLCRRCYYPTLVCSVKGDFLVCKWRCLPRSNTNCPK